MNAIQLERRFWQWTQYGLLSANVVAVAFMFLVHDPLLDGSSSKRLPHPEAATDRPIGVPIRLSDLTRRNLFRPLVAPPAPKKIVVSCSAPPPPPKIPISQKAAHLHLVGIINGNPIQAVVEDTQSHTTFYVTPGQAIGEIQIDKILSDRVILTSADDRMDLML